MCRTKLGKPYSTNIRLHTKLLGFQFVCNAIHIETSLNPICPEIRLKIPSLHTLDGLIAWEGTTRRRILGYE